MQKKNSDRYKYVALNAIEWNPVRVLLWARRIKGNYLHSAIIVITTKESWVWNAKRWNGNN